MKKNRRDQASEQIKHYIRSHRMEPGELLAPVRALSDHFEVSRDAAWRALQRLQEEDWISARANRRYEISADLYTRILSSLRVKGVFTGISYIHFSGYRRLADSLRRQCRYHNMEFRTTLLPMGEKPDESIWDDCDVLLVDSVSSRSILEHFPKFKVPVIGLDAEYSNRYHLNIVTDHHLGGRMVAERLISDGSKRVHVVHFQDSESMPRIKARIDGFRQVWLESGRSEKDLHLKAIKFAQNNFDLALNVREELLNFDGKGDFFVTDGTLAITHLEILDHLGYSVPDNLRLIGYDSAQTGETTNPPMTTIQQDMDTIACKAIERMGEYTGPHKGKTELIRIPPILVERISG